MSTPLQILSEYGSVIAELEEITGYLDELNQRMQEALHGGIDSFYIVPGVDYMPGDYIDTLRKATRQLQKVYDKHEKTLTK